MLFRNIRSQYVRYYASPLISTEGGDRSVRRNIVVGFSLRLWAVNTIVFTSVAQLIRLPCIFQCKQSCQLFGGLLQNRTNLVLAFCNVVIVTNGCCQK
jgi:hypothetical protein